MRLIDIKMFKAFWRQHPDALQPLKRWYDTAEKCDWQNIEQVRKTYPHADTVRVASGNTATVFNIAGNKYRLITAIHYNTQVIYLMMVLTHKEYDSDKWKGIL